MQKIKIPAKTVVKLRVAKAAKNSVLGVKVVSKCGRRHLFFYPPMMALPVRDLPTGNWIYEMKYDGYRALLSWFSVNWKNLIWALANQGNCCSS
jgi:ATP-dependent DNA ligase